LFRAPNQFIWGYNRSLFSTSEQGKKWIGSDDHLMKFRWILSIAIVVLLYFSIFRERVLNIAL